MADDRKVQVAIEANAQGLIAGLNQATSAIKEHTEKMGGMFGELGERMTGATDKLSGFTEGFAAMGPALGILAGAAVAVKGIEVAFDLVKESIHATLEQAEAFQKVGYKVGGSFDNLNAADAAMKMVGGSLEQLGSLSTQAARAMKANEKAINDNGVATRDASGHFLQFNDYLKNVVERADQMATPMDRNQLLITALGRAGADAGPQLKELVEHMEEGRAVAEKYGNIIGADDVKAMQEFKAAQGEMGYAFEAMQSQVGRQVIPALTELLKILAEYLPAAMEMLKGGIELVVDGTILMSKGIERADEWGKALQTTLGVGLVGAMQAVAQAQRGDLAGAIDTMKLSVDSVGIAWKAATAEVAAYDAVADKMATDMTSKLNSGGGAGGLGPGGSGQFQGKGGKDTGQKDQLAALREHLKEMEDARADDDQMSKAEVAAYWKSILDTDTLSAKERLEVFHEYVAARRAAEKDQAAQAKAAAKQAAEVSRLQDEEELSHAEAGMAQKRAMLDAEVAAHKITASERLQIEKQMLDQEYGLELAALKKKLELDAQDPARRQQALNAIQKLDDKYRLDKLKLDTQLVKKEETLWDQMYKKIGQSAQQNIDAMIHGTETFGQAVRNVATSIADTFIQMGEQMLVKWITTMVESTAASKTSAASEITANAGVAATAAMASVAAIPIVGWAMAPGVGASTEALALGYLASASASQGYDIPAGVNPVTQLHQREMVLPAEQADTIRGLAARGGSSGGNTYHITAMDGLDVERVLRRHGAALGRGVRAAVRSGNLGRRS